jgi:hypothetical protein
VCFLLPKTNTCLAQDSLQWELIEEFSLPSFEQVRINPKGQICLTQENGILLQLDKYGNTNALFSPERTGEITSLFTNNPLQIFLFYAEWQEFIILNRLLDPLKEGNFQDLSLNSNLDLGFIQFACPSVDNQLWLVDNSDFSLKKYDMLHHVLEAQTSLDLLLEGDFYALKSLQVYQNKLYLHTQNGILIFDMYGNYQQKIPIQNVNTLRFYEESFYFFDKENQKVVFRNLYTNESKQISIPSDFTEEILEVIYFDNKVYLFFQNDFKVFLYP